MSKRVVVLALGGNGIQPSNSKGSYADQFKNIDITAQQIADLVASRYKVVITHGNGPQVGTIMTQMSAASDSLPEQPMRVCGAMTQGQIGYLLQSRLQYHLHKLCGIPIPVCTVVTQVVVDKADPAFQNPTKPVGSFYSKEEADRIAKTNGYSMKEVAPEKPKSWRRVVCSPKPQDIVEIDSIMQLLDNHIVVISCGGGGIPVIRKEDGECEGIDAVIDKDYTAALLAKKVDADYLMILTDVEKVAVNYGKPEQKWLDRLSSDEAERMYESGEFPAGSMGPKVLAAIDFIRWGGEGAVITSLEKAREALDGKTGTHFTK